MFLSRYFSILVYYGLQLWSGIECFVGHSCSPMHYKLSDIEMSLDQTIDPCEDFYGYACNNWAEHHTNLKYNEIIGQVDYQFNSKMINVFNSAYKHHQGMANGCQSFVEKTLTYYKACTKETTPNFKRYFEVIKPARGLEWPLIELLKAHLVPHTPTSTEWSKGLFNVFALLGQLQGYGLHNVLISQEITQTANGSLQITLDMPYVSEEDIIPPPAIIGFLKHWGLPEQSVMQYTEEITNTEAYWLGEYEKYSTSSDNEPLKLTYAQVKSLYPPLVDFLEHIIPQRIQDTDLVVISNEDYIQFLVNKTWTSLESYHICNYIMTKFLMYLVEDSSVSFASIDCLKDLRNKMDLSVNYLYLKHSFQPQLLQYLKPLWQKILEYYVQVLDENSLNLSIEQLQHLKEKLSSVDLNLGNLPGDEMRVCQIEEFYQDLPPLEVGNYYKNHLHLLRHRFLKSLLYAQNQTFFMATDNRAGSSSAPIYVPKQNRVILPLGFLQPPVYHSEYHPLFEWSMLGFLLAHEITHAIDTVGLQYTPDGHVLDTDEAGIQKNQNFTDSLKCMQEQQPTESIDERVADLMGARVAYTAYIREYNFAPQPQISRRPWKTLFFLNMAQFFCGRKDVQFVDHDDDAVRLQQIVSNLEGFAEAFQCPAGRSKMNPTHKCRLY